MIQSVIYIMDNTVGSLTQFQKSVISGTILGDGYLRIVSGRKDAHLEVNHSIKQKAYVDWKYSILSDVTQSPPKSRNTNGERIAYRFTTKQHPYLTELFLKFYQNNSKIIPNMYLDPVILSVWYMDDGSRCSENDYYLNTQQFSIDDQIRLLSMLKSLDLKANLNRDTMYHRIRFYKSSIPKLKELISEYIIPEMKYKIGL